ncbi:hypothetical protein GUJ93_ZPchr0002g24726 [Zizania palustris]|uniref:Uncharacterized protein n=1 Tax=Zizania palustris TaxID=103762 RepID=A0A8J5SGK8_ZIZPA|nr:hypothetical protein GUJ93_ZPchr0002g24726 [Zizania palustris]
MSGERGGSTSTICWRVLSCPLSEQRPGGVAQQNRTAFGGGVSRRRVCQSGVLPAHLPERRLAGVSAGATTRRHVHRSGDAAACPKAVERSPGGGRPPRQSGGEDSWRVLLTRAAERSPGASSSAKRRRGVLDPQKQNHICGRCASAD